MNNWIEDSKSEVIDYKSPTNLQEAAETFKELNEPVESAKRTTLTQVEWLLLTKNKAIYDIENVQWLSWKYLVFWMNEDNYFISLTSNLWLYNTKFDFKFKWKSRNEIINNMNEELKKFNFEVPVESKKWR
jgi:hypothetical protein